ncbi:MAG: hypothetical protein HYV60_15790, partial [Planctomycetia bacterium]|nr:hypothetical protein [Planctomycetia bacterium]
MDCIVGLGRCTPGHARWQRALPIYVAVFLLVTGFAGTWPPSIVLGQEDGVLEDVGSGPPTSSPKAKERTVLDTLKDGGVVGLVIILCSVVSVGFIVEHFMTIRKTTLMPEAVAADLEALIAQGQVDQAIEYCNDPPNHSMFSTVVLAGLERYKGSEFGFAEYKAAVEEAGEDQTGSL